MGWFNNKEEEQQEPIEEDKSESEEESNTYAIEIECDNCGSNYEYEVPKGTLVKDFCKEEICEDCGCKLAAVSDEE